MNYELIVSTRANLEIAKALGYLNHKVSLEIALQFSNNIIQMFDLIQVSPFSFQDYGSFRQVPMKNFKYVITYKIQSNTIYITSIFHTSQNPIKKP